MFSTILTGALRGVRAYLVRAEVDIAPGLPGFSMVGSLSGEVREARERVMVALRNIGYEIMAKRITVNLAPADVRKDGTAFDLPIAVGVLRCLGYFTEEAAEGILFLGELGLNGEIKPVRGVLPIVVEAARQGIKQCIVPEGNVGEGAVIPGIVVRGASDIGQLVEFLKQNRENQNKILPQRQWEANCYKKETEQPEDFAEVIGQETAKRAAEIAAAGFHNMLMIGPPGAGKSMIAKRLPGILPPLTMEEQLEVSSVYSVAGLLGEKASLIGTRPFQNPHHTISQAALVGGSSVPRPGMLSLSHRGVLFLDELPEFSRSVLDSMRQPLEEKEVHIARMYGNVSYPADFLLVCAMNPCLCGYYPDYDRCTCTEAEVRRYLGRVSGPILDRIDLCVELSPVDITHLKSKREEESSRDIRERVMKARKWQDERFRGSEYRFNADIRPADMERFCSLGKEEQELMECVFYKMKLSARGYHRILKVARTIADLAGEERILTEHLAEAVCYRTADKGYWKRG